MNTQDRRVRKTQKALQLALAELMLTKDLRGITVQELADKADIHRATFYSHYHDVYDLYEQLEQSVISGLGAIVSTDPTHSYSDVYERIIDYIYDDPALWRMLLSKRGNRTFQNRIYELLEQNYLNIWSFEEHKTNITDEMRYLSTYHIQGCIAIISLWVNSNFSYSKKDITALINKVDDNIDHIY